MANTTFGYVVKDANTQVVAGAVKGLGATLQQLVFTGGVFTANGTSPVTVDEPAVTANSAIIITLKTPDGTVGNSAPAIKTITPGTGFTVTALASDTSDYTYLVIG